MISLDLDGTLIDASGQLAYCTLKEFQEIDDIIIATNNSTKSNRDLRLMLHRNGFSNVRLVGVQDYARVLVKHLESKSVQLNYFLSSSVQQYLTCDEAIFDKFFSPCSSHLAVLEEMSGVSFVGRGANLSEMKKIIKEYGENHLTVFLNRDQKSDSSVEVTAGPKLLGDQLAFLQSKNYISLCKSDDYFIRSLENLIRPSTIYSHYGDNITSDGIYASKLKSRFRHTEYKHLVNTPACVFENIPNTTTAIISCDNQFLLRLETKMQQYCT